MTVIALQLIGSDAPKVARFISREVGIRTGNSWSYPESREAIVDDPATYPDHALVDLYNSLAPDISDRVTAFPDRRTAAERLWDMILTMVPETSAKELAEMATTNSKTTTKAPGKGKAAPATKTTAPATTKLSPEEKAKAKAAAAAAKANAPKAEKKPPAPRVSKLAGKFLFPGPKCPTGDKGKVLNPRRAGSTAGKSIQIIIDKPGISLTDFVAKGGRMKDAHYDIDHGFAVAKDAAK